MKASQKLQYAADLQHDGEDGAAYLLSNFNIFCLEDLKDYVETEQQERVLDAAIERA